ncbi:MAG: carboxypeptidase-like regulatory domain-containing protein [Cytophagales bacterium]|nr:carboxypeptidase-like regulatory domain-containing protein [Cytophagales bacterium]
MSVIWKKNQWSTPANLGPTVNTVYDEMFPFIKNNTIYYSSNRPGGLGGLDIFYTTLDKKGKTKNIGYPINSNSDDFGIIFEKNGASGYFSSSRSPNQVHDDNLYSFKVNEVKLNIKANERLTNAPMANVRVTCKQVAGETDTVYTDSTGRATILLKPSYLYNLTASKSGYRDISSSVSTKTFTTSGFLNAAFNFDRRYKSYVNIFVSEKENENEDGVNNCTVLIYNLTRQKLDTTVTNNEGKSLIEVENENLYSFIAFNENKTMRGVEKLSTKKLGKFSKILFLYPKLEKSIVSSISISTVNADSLQPLANTKITIVDKTLNFTSECFADDEGKFTFIGFPDHSYKIVAKKSIYRAEILEYKPKSYKESLQLQLKSQLE